MIKISVVIPCYNVEGYIEECLDSVYNQTYENIEVIAVDNNSNDNTLKCLKDYQTKQQALIILDESKKGAPAARNKGLSVAKGDWIQFLDADDLLIPSKIEHQVKLIKLEQEVDFVAAAKIEREIDNKEKIVSIPYNEEWTNLFVGNLGNTCSNLFNKQALLKIGGWNENLKSSQETTLMFELLKNDYNVFLDQKPLTIIRKRIEGQISNKSNENLIRRAQLRLKMFDYMYEHNLINPKNQYVIHLTLYSFYQQLKYIDSDLSMKCYKKVPVGFKPKTSIKTILYRTWKNIIN